MCHFNNTGKLCIKFCFSKRILSSIKSTGGKTLHKIFHYAFGNSVNIGFQNKEKKPVKIRHDISFYFILTST